MLEWVEKTDPNWGLLPKFIKETHLKRRLLEEEKQKKLLEELNKKVEQEKKAKLQALYERRRGISTKEIKARQNFTYDEIECRICCVFGYTPEQIKSQEKTRRLVLARQAIMYWATRLTKHSISKIGDFMGGKDHSTIFYGEISYRKKRGKTGRHLRKAR